MAQTRNDTASLAPAVSSNAGWVVTFAGTGINLALGVLYTWSVISVAIEKQNWGWTEAERSLPYSVAVLMFAFATIAGGRMQDKLGPSLTASVGGVLVGLGMIVASFFTSVLGYVIGFGLIAGTGIGFGYASATPPAVKWFSKAKTGLIAGIVVSGFGLASAYAAPTAQWLADSFGLQTMMLSFGIAFLIVVVALAQFLRTPPPGYVPKDEAAARPSGPAAASASAPISRDYSPGQMLRTPQFYLLWVMYGIGAGAGLMIIGKMAKISVGQAGISLGFLLVALLAVGNGGGRILAGMVSDKIGRMRTLMACMLLQAVLLVIVSQTVTGSFLASAAILGLVAALIGAMYGSNLAVFPAVAKDYFGLSNFGVNYGLLFTSWGVGGSVMSLIAGATWSEETKSFGAAYFMAAGLLVVAALMTQLVKPPAAAVER